MKQLRFLKRINFDTVIAIIGFICIFLMMRASNDPIVSILKGTRIESTFQQFHTGNEVIFNISAGVIASLLTFYLLVRAPAHEKKVRIKKYLVESYRYYKKEAITIFLWKVNGSADMDLVDRLVDVVEFRNYFKHPSRIPGQDRWHVVANNLSDDDLKRLQLESEIMHQELMHAIGSIDISDREIYGFIRGISESMYRSKNWTNDYDGVKQPLRFYWHLFAGWSRETGYRDSDPLQEKLLSL